MLKKSKKTTNEIKRRKNSTGKFYICKTEGKQMNNVGSVITFFAVY